MTERTITIDRRYLTEYEFLFRAMTTLGIPHAESHTESRFRVFTAETGKNRAAMNAYLAEILLTPFRYRYFTANALSPALLSDYLLTFCAMNADGAREYVRIMDVIDPLSELHVDALYNFGLGEFKARWSRRAKLISDFIETMPSESDVLDFCRCLIEGTPSRAERKIRFYLSEDENVRALQRYAYYGEEITHYPRGSEEAKRMISALKR